MKMIIGRFNLSDAERGLLLALALLSVPGVQAAGRTAFPLLQELLDPRALALGGAVVQDAKTPGAVAVNPAAAAAAGRGAALSHARHSLDLWSGRFGGWYRLPHDRVAGFYLGTYNYGKFDRIVDGAKTGSFDAAENVLALHFAGMFHQRLGYGAALKLMWGSIDDANASGKALDVGLNYDPGWQRLKFGAALLNAGSQNNAYGGASAPLPSELVIGGSRRLEGLPLTLSLAAQFGRDGEGVWEVPLIGDGRTLSAAAGGEFEFGGGSGRRPFNLRFGYRSLADGLKSGIQDDMLAGMSAGFGLPVAGYTVEYAFASLGGLGATHRFGVAGSF